MAKLVFAVGWHILAILFIILGYRIVLSPSKETLEESKEGDVMLKDYSWDFEC